MSSPSSSSESFIVVSMLLLLLQFSSSVHVSASASTKYIDTICRMRSVRDKTFCLKTLTAYPPAVSATDLFPLVETVFRLGMSHALKIASFAAEAAKEEPTTLKTQFKLCNEAYVDLEQNLRIAIVDLKEDPMSGNYDTMISFDKTSYVKGLIGKNTDKASKRLMEMTLQFEKLLSILVGATEAVGG